MPSAPPGQEPLVLVDFRAGVARLTLNNPARKNAITRDMVRIIVQFCDRVESDETIGAAIIDARGGYFCSGADTRDLARRIKKSADLELGPPAVPWAAAIELERGVQMWSLGRKGEAYWSTPPQRSDC